MKRILLHRLQGAFRRNRRSSAEDGVAQPRMKNSSVSVLRKASIFLVLILFLIGVGILIRRLTHRPFSHAPDYSWVAGELYYSNLEDGFWGIRYGERGEDKYGEHFVLGKSLPGDFQDGDLVLVRGQISEEQVSIFMAGWIYKVEEMVKYSQ